MEAIRVLLILRFDIFPENIPVSPRIRGEFAVTLESSIGDAFQRVLIYGSGRYSGDLPGKLYLRHLSFQMFVHNLLFGFSFVVQIFSPEVYGFHIRIFARRGDLKQSSAFISLPQFVFFALLAL